MNTYLKSVKAEDCDILFEWANDPETRKQSFNSNPIAYEDHVKWFDSKLQSPDSRIFILMCDDTPSGTIRLDRISDSGNFLISYSIAPSMRGKGLGKEILRLVIDEAEPGTIFEAYVKPENQASRRCFEALGFTEEKNKGEIEFTFSKK